MARPYRLVLEEPLGARLVFARDGLEGLDRAAQEGTVDLYIMDIDVPRLAGAADFPPEPVEPGRRLEVVSGLLGPRG
ncbi:MAG TPA: hypothetical protein VMK65_08880 [Longimicrobiales bacterium]|nr:hypothetical protein [Longimicrobiales bacterium]